MRAPHRERLCIAGTLHSSENLGLLSVHVTAWAKARDTSAAQQSAHCKAMRCRLVWQSTASPHPSVSLHWASLHGLLRRQGAC